ncbi:MAG: glycosyltransferase [Solirubrobacteraceae bacterium]
MSRHRLQATLECELPRTLAVGAGTALFVCGWCFCREASISALELELEGQPPQPVMAAGMPRLDPFRALHPFVASATGTPGSPPHEDGDPLGHSYRSGFWGILRVLGPRQPSRAVLRLTARLADGGQCSAPLGELELVEPRAPAADAVPDGASAAESVSDGSDARRPQPTIAICMATHDPPPALLRRQIESIRAQSHRSWVCLISDDCSGADGQRALREAIADDERFVVSRSPRRLGFYANFERALTMVSATVPLVALSDQDDCWHPDKLATLLDALGESQLAYSDARVVTRDGETVSETWWSTRRNNHSNLLSLLVANAVTGAAALFRRELLDYALPFPPGQFAHFHDHWLGVTALAVGEITFVDRPLYDYVQHDGASLGHAAANQMPSLRERLTRRRRLHERVRLWRLHYFVDMCRLLQFATVIQMRCGQRMSARKRRELEMFLRAERSPTLMARFFVRGLRELTGKPETLGAEWMLLHALLWRRLLTLTARDRPQARLRLDALPPATLALPPRRQRIDHAAASIADKVAPLRWMTSDEAPTRINILVPTLDLQHLFGGYIAKFNLARRLHALGCRVRIVTVDPVGPLPPDHRRQIESYSGLSGLFDEVELVFGRESSAIEVSARDGFVATTWWTAHIASDALRALAARRPFAYLIQEYEPFTFAMGSWAALASESYGFDHAALFSSELLRDYFRRHAIGVYARGSADGDAASRSFENAITPVASGSPEELRQREPRRLLFYARPEAHAARNMFELGVLALARALAAGAFAGWELHGIGTTGRGGTIELGAGARLTLLPRTDQAAYARILREHDVGLALMYTPHPSLAPIEMASAGMLTVTNAFENKTAAAMARISTNLIVAEPSVEAVADALCEASRRAADIERRCAGSRVSWSSDWRRSLPDDLLRWLLESLQVGG